MGKAIVTVKVAGDTNSVTLAKNAYTSGDKLVKSTMTAIESTFAIFASKAVSLEVHEDIKELFYDFMVNNLDEETLSKVGTKADKTGEERYTFRSHPATKCIWQYQTVVSKAVERGCSWTDIFEMEENKHNGSFKLPSKGAVEQLKKPDVSNIDKLEGLVLTCQKIVKKMSGDTTEDKKKAASLANDLFQAAQALEA